ncbi:unnamed protein product [Rhodiola kirilowii]
MSSASAQGLMFQQRLDPLTGNSEWVVIVEEEEEGDGGSWEEESKSPLLAKTSYLDMLNDTRRNRAYYEAIKKTITKPCHVLDIGAGTGLLSMMTARTMEQLESTSSDDLPGVVTACESYLPMVKLMRRVLRLNGMERKIHIINKRSDELKVGVDISSRADVMVSEILDSELLGEGLIPTLQNAHDMLLVENALTVPYRATTYGQLVECQFLRKLHDLHGNEAHVSDNIHLVPPGLESVLRIKQQQYPMHCDSLSDEIKLLTEPFKIFEFDFWKRPESHEEINLILRATRGGTAHAVVSWWVLQLDHGGTIFYSTAPSWISLPIDNGDLGVPDCSQADWCDHWKQCVWFIPGKGLSLSQEEEIRLHARHNETAISYNLTKACSREGMSEHITYDASSALLLSPERIAIYGDSEWRFSLLTAAQKILALTVVTCEKHPCLFSLQLQGKDSYLCVVADDSVFLTILIASLSKESHVISLFPGLQDGGKYLQAVADANGFSIDRVKVAKKRSRLTMQDTEQRKVDLLIGEPFYYGNDGMLPWQNLRFWKERTKLDSMLSGEVKIMPCKGVLKACAMSLPDLWKSRRCLGKVEGFDHSAINSILGASGAIPSPQESPFLPFYIWQCGNIEVSILSIFSVELSVPVEIMEFDFAKPISSCCGQAKIELIKPGICHGLVFWIDWVLDEEKSIIISTGPDQRYWKQGVKLLAMPKTVETNGATTTSNTSCTINASFDPSDGELVVQHAFAP